MRFLQSFVLLLPLAAATRYEAVEPHMGTLVHIVVYAENQAAASVAFRTAFARISTLDGILSDYKPDSELNRLCERQRLRISEDLYAVLAAGLRIAAESDGAFDITAAPVIRLWREARRTKRVPSADALAEARRHAGWRKLTLNPSDHEAILSESGMKLDVGGLAKGYVAGEAAQALRGTGIQSGLVAASGDIVAFGPRQWPVTIELGGGTRDIMLRNAAVSTAGDTEQFVIINGVRYSHIIDPFTGQALTSRIAVAVVAKTGLEADALDTTLAVMGARKGFALLREHHKDVAALVVDDGRAAEFNSRAWQRLLPNAILKRTAQ